MESLTDDRVIEMMKRGSPLETATKYGPRGVISDGPKTTLDARAQYPISEHVMARLIANGRIRKVLEIVVYKVIDD